MKKNQGQCKVFSEMTEMWALHTADFTGIGYNNFFMHFYSKKLGMYKQHIR